MHNLNLVKAGYCCLMSRGCCLPPRQSSIHPQGLVNLSRRIRLVPSRGPNRALSSPRARRHSENKKKRNQNTEKRSHEASCLHPAPRKRHLEGKRQQTFQMSSEQSEAAASSSSDCNLPASFGPAVSIRSSLGGDSRRVVKSKGWRMTGVLFPAAAQTS